MHLEKLFISSPYNYNRAQKLDSRNRIHVLRKLSVFDKKHILQIFFQKLIALKLLFCIFCGQVEISSGKQTYDITCPTGKLIKKLISTPSLISFCKVLSVMVCF